MNWTDSSSLTKPDKERPEEKHEHSPLPWQRIGSVILDANSRPVAYLYHYAEIGGGYKGMHQFPNVEENGNLIIDSVNATEDKHGNDMA